MRSNNFIVEVAGKQSSDSKGSSGKEQDIPAEKPISDVSVETRNFETSKI